MKHIGIIGIFLCLLCIFFGVYVVYFRINPRIVESTAESFHFDELSLIEDYADVIVRVKVSGRKKTIIESAMKIGNQEVPIFGYTLTTAEVIKTYKGQELIKNNTIEFIEPYYERQGLDFTKLIATFENYRPAKTGKEYLLFLRVDKDRDQLTVFSTYQCKVPVNNEVFDPARIDKLTARDLEIGNGLSPFIFDSYKEVLKEIIEKYKE